MANDPSWDAKGSRHLRLLNRKLMRIADPEDPLKRLMVFMPPRHGKSMLSTNYFPAFWLMNKPDEKVMTISNTASLARQWGRFTRDVVNEWGPLTTGVHVANEPSAADDWQVLGHFGGLVAMGVGGTPVGRGANLLLVDDPVAGQEAALSAHQREVMYEWWKGTIRNRLEPGGAIVLIMTRWHEDDLAGRLLADADEEWDVVRFPAIAEEDEHWDDGTVRLKGEALWPGRWPLSELEVLQKSSGPFWWAALFQQRPAPQGGGSFKREWFKYFQVDEDVGLYILKHHDGQVTRVRIDQCHKFSTIDPAFTEKTTSDYTVIQTWAVTPNSDLLLLDQYRAKMEGPDIVPAMRTVYNQWTPGAMYVERVGAQLMIVQDARRQGLPVQELPTEGDKIARAMPLQARMAGGGVYFRQGAAYTHELEDELLMFPNGRHDDQVDAGAYAAIVLAGRGGKVGSIRRFLR